MYGAEEVGSQLVVTRRDAPEILEPAEHRQNIRSMGATLKRLESGTNFNVSQLVIDKMQTGVRQMLFDNPLPPEVQAGLTATEVSARIRQFYDQDP